MFIFSKLKKIWFRFKVWAGLISPTGMTWQSLEKAKRDTSEYIAQHLHSPDRRVIIRFLRELGNKAPEEILELSEAEYQELLEKFRMNCG